MARGRREEMTVTLSTKGQLVIPKPYRDALGLKDGSRLVIWQEGNCLLLVPAERFGTATKGLTQAVLGGTTKAIEDYLTKERGNWEKKNS